MGHEVIVFTLFAGCAECDDRRAKQEGDSPVRVSP